MSSAAAILALRELHRRRRTLIEVKRSSRCARRKFWREVGRYVDAVRVGFRLPSRANFSGRSTSSAYGRACRELNLQMFRKFGEDDLADDSLV